MPQCEVVGCTSGNPWSPKEYHLFSVPASPEILELWRISLNQGSLQPKQKICERHFSSEDILWQDRLVVGSNGLVSNILTSKTPRLRKGAVPSIFSWMENPMEENAGVGAFNTPCPEFVGIPELDEDACMSEDETEIANPLSEQIEDITEDKDNLENLTNSETTFKITKQEIPDKNDLENSTNLERKSKIPKVEIPDKDDLENSANSETTLESKKPEITDKPDLENLTSLETAFGIRKLAGAAVSVPAGWTKHVMHCGGNMIVGFSFFKCLQFDDRFKIIVLKQVIIKADLTFLINVVGRAWSGADLDIDQSPLKNLEKVEALLRNIDSLIVCEGTKLPDNSNTNGKTRIDRSGNVRHKECYLLLPTGRTCTLCLGARRSVNARKRKRQPGDRRKTLQSE